MIDVKNLSKKYKTQDGEVVALDGVSLRVKEGDFVAIVGRSGSGKTTLLNMLAGLDKPDHGSVVFDGVNVTALSEEKKAYLRRGKIGVVYQFYNLIPELNVRENILLPTELDGRNIDEAWFDTILNAVGMQGRAHAYPNALSGGQQQRVAIARALFSRPKLLLADEPTGNLDAENTREVLRLLRMMNEEYGVTLLVVTHSEEVAAVAKRRITFEAGRMIQGEGGL